MKDSLGVIGIYSDEPIGMDHPLFMARMEARLHGQFAARRGLTLDEALTGARDRIRGLFGDVPQPLVDATVTTAWLAASERPGDGDE